VSRRPAAAVLLALALAACAGDGDAGDDGAAATTATTARGRPTTTAATTTTTDPGYVVGVSRPATPTCPAVPAGAEPDRRRPRYDLDLTLDLAADAVDGRLEVRFQPDLPTDRLVFRLWANGPRPSAAGARLEAGPVTLTGDGGRGVAATEAPDPTTLVVRLGRVVGRGDAVSASMPWRLQLPGASDDRLSRTGDAVRLGSFFPILAWEPGRGWAREPATGAFAEASVAPVADFAYSVSVPEGLAVLGSGVEERPGRWWAPAHRDVALSVGRFRTVEATVDAPEPVRVVVGAHEGVEDEPGPYLDRVTDSLIRFAERFGPYPYRSLTLALSPALDGGIEYPGHIMQGPGTLGATTPHEVAHQWFYGLVGNNQGRDPWLDEGLASWAEGRYTGTLPRFVRRDIPRGAEGRTAEPMAFWSGRQGLYYEGVYVQGAQALSALGPPERVECGLRHYVARHAFTVARPPDLLSSLRRVFPEAATVLARFGIAG
jgi:hypothetical protein